MSTTLFLIRHGETAWNRDKIFRGSFDIELNENGRNQARLAAQALESRPIDAGYTSPLSRAAETARIVLESHQVTALSHEGLLDFDYGDWTGKPDIEVAQQWPAEHALWNSHPDQVRVPGGDTLEEVSARAFAALEQIAARHDNQTVALFSHRVVNKLLIMASMGLGLERFPFIIQGNCSINQLERIPEGYLIHALNDTSHMRNASAELLETDF